MDFESDPGWRWRGATCRVRSRLSKGDATGAVDTGSLKSQRERGDFEAAVRRASERHKERKRSLEKMERKARENPDHALAAALILEANARAGRRLGRRYLYSRWGVKVYSRRPSVAYAVVRPERSPKDSRQRVLRAQALVEHGGWEAVWMALRAGFDHFGPLDQPRMACKFAFETLRQTPALWGYFIEKAREPDDSVREHAAAELAGWLDSETRLYPRTRKVVGGREGKLQEIAGVAAAAWADLQPGEPFWLPNKFVSQFNEKRKKDSLASRGGSLLDAPAALEAEELEAESAIPSTSALAEFEAAETSVLLNQLIEQAGLSAQQAAVFGRRRLGEEIAHIAEELGISKNQVAVQTNYAIEKLKQAAGQ
jgi:hypothetical protein